MRRLWILVGIGLFTLGACEKENSVTNSKERLCDPGETNPCYGTQGCHGDHACSADGSAWEACTCTVEDCDAGTHRCSGDFLETCNDDGTGFRLVEECDAGTCDASAPTCSGSGSGGTAGSLGSGGADNGGTGGGTGGTPPGGGGTETGGTSSGGGGTETGGTSSGGGGTETGGTGGTSAGAGGTETAGTPSGGGGGSTALGGGAGSGTGGTTVAGTANGGDSAGGTSGVPDRGGSAGLGLGGVAGESAGGTIEPNGGEAGLGGGSTTIPTGCAAITGTPYFCDDFEAGLSKWVVSGQDWNTTNTTARSGDHSITDSPDGDYAAGSNAATTFAASVDLSAASVVNPVLSFWYKLTLACNVANAATDHVYVEGSNDGGTTWSNLVTWTGSANTSTWLMSQVGLSAYVGRALKVRFRLADGSFRPDCEVQADGWYIDDVVIQEAN